MIHGQILVYRFNGIWNSKSQVPRNQFTIQDVKVQTKEQFQHSISEALDEVPPGAGYVLVKWTGRIFICEKDRNKPQVAYVRHEIRYHPLAYAFTI